MRIKLHTILAGPTIALFPGEHPVADELGSVLCNAGFAKSLEAGRQPGLPPIESAAIEPPEHAVLPKPKKRKPKGE